MGSRQVRDGDVMHFSMGRIDKPCVEYPRECDGVEFGGGSDGDQPAGERCKFRLQTIDQIRESKNENIVHRNGPAVRFAVSAK